MTPHEDGDESGRPTRKPIPPYVRSRLVRGVYRASWGLTGALTAAFMLLGIGPAASFLSGAFIALFFLWSLEYLLRWIYQSPEKRKGFRAVLLVVGKYVAVGIVFYHVTRQHWMRVGYMALGVCVVYLGTVFYLVLNLKPRSS